MAADAQPTVREAAEAIAREGGKDLLAGLLLDLMGEGLTVHSEARGRPVARIRLEDGAVVVNLLEPPSRLMHRVGDAMERVDKEDTPFGEWRWVVELAGSPVGEFGRGAEAGLDARRVARAVMRSLMLSGGE